MEKTFEPWAAWGPCEDEVASDALARLTADNPRLFDTSTVEGARSADLSFYDEHRLIELELEHPFGTDRIYVLDSGDETRWLDGSSGPIHETNEEESLALTDAAVHDYIRLFLYFVRGDEGAFGLLESPNEIDVLAADSLEQDGSSDVDALELEQRLAYIRSRIAPLTTRMIDDRGRWVVDGTIAYGDDVFASTFAVPPSGLIEMTEDESFETLDHLSVPEYPSLELAAEPGSVAHDLDESDELSRDRDVTEAIVSVLLEDALREHDAATEGSRMLLRHFNSETGADKQIDRLTRLVSGSVPVIILESDIPFVEDFVAGLIEGPNLFVTGGAVTRAPVVDGDELRCSVNYESTTTKLHLISFHAYRGLYDAERTAHELAIRDAAVLIGCDRRGDVPEALRRIADLVLTFPRIDRSRFARIFERVFQVKPAPGWDAAGTDWTRYLVPADFHAPRRLNLAPIEALEFLRERVEGRLAQVTPDIGPKLSELHGLGEARQICEDLLADIRAAHAGQIPWTAVDKGMLLVGAPGTGKTTLARALAKECGIKFVVASAASWQSAGALDAHLLAMRADFTEARRYAPAILFIDEIDSIGSREQLSGDRNIVYQTEVINSLLEQIQGINTVEPVIVIGATNYPERVDPALRRAGRLDQVVQLPRPNIAGLEQIYSYYLAPYRVCNEVARGVKGRTLAELSLGLTGADVELFVRGAARRARRARRKIKQEDLVAEITGRPRRADSAPRLGPDEMRRVAVHEAGHAVSRLLSSTRGEDVTFVTIVPRMDGSLGFVASVPDERNVATRRTMMEELETMLAGRAAEEVVFGADDVGGGAGGPSRTSDLASATRMAELIVCRSGLGDDGALRWTEQPTPAQEKQIDALLGKAYKSSVARLEGEQALLDRVAELLVDEQELSGADLRKLLATDGVTVAMTT